MEPWNGISTKSSNQQNTQDNGNIRCIRIVGLRSLLRISLVSNRLGQPAIWCSNKHERDGTSGSSPQWTRLRRDTSHKASPHQPREFTHQGLGNIEQVTYYWTVCIFGRQFTKFIVTILNFYSCVASIRTAVCILEVSSIFVSPCQSQSWKDSNRTAI